MIERLNQAEALKATIQTRKDSETTRLLLKTDTPMSEEAFAKYVSEHNCHLTRADIMYAMSVIADSLIEVLADGKALKWEDIGIFKLVARDGKPRLMLLPDRHVAQLLKKLKIKIVPK